MGFLLALFGGGEGGLIVNVCRFDNLRGRGVEIVLVVDREERV